MPEPFGNSTHVKILKSESQKLHQEFTVDDLKATITFSADLVTSNVVNGAINGVAIDAVTFTTDHDNTMDLLLAALEANDAVASASLTDATNNRQITVIAADPEALFILSGFAVTLGASQATVTTAQDSNNVYKSQPVKLTVEGKIEPAGAAEAPMNVIGSSIHNGVGGDLVTVSMKSHMIVYAVAGTASLNAGPVKLHSTPYNSSLGYVSVDDDSVSATNIYGWALDNATSAGDIVRVAVL